MSDTSSNRTMEVVQRAKERVTELIRFEYNELKNRLAFTQMGATMSGNTVEFEFRVEGISGGGAIPNLPPSPVLQTLKDLVCGA